jgi:formylglycine-generating enzyme required for sulfatase activity
VTHVSYHDAAAFAEWSGKQLPTEAEWELAARGGLDGATFAWGDEFTVNGRYMANTWHGRFPFENLHLDGYKRTSPVGKFPSNGYGLVDMCGNVWEWTSDSFAPHHALLDESNSSANHSCCGPVKPSRSEDSQTSSRVIKGGSHLCAPNYCLRYRPAARQAQTPDTSTSHIGFRCVIRSPSGPRAYSEGFRL